MKDIPKEKLNSDSGFRKPADELVAHIIEYCEREDTGTPDHKYIIRQVGRILKERLK
jgi:hypothetical protein